ncbi:sulfotransferase domain-containing protein [Nocardia sp. CA-136227]|uniref:sulfotransferase domain-containing protein n=1 Tax=Nocardia sp. CA-136227 TaxID=3239979 RepID=UPI003D99307A
MSKSDSAVQEGACTGNDRYTEGFRVFEQWQLQRYRNERHVQHPVRSLRLGWRYLTLSHYFGAVPPIRLWWRSRFGGPRALPDFTCVGALKSGTTDLAAYLMQHPSVVVPLTKEIGHGFPAAWGPYLPTEREKAAVAERTGRALVGHFDPLLHDVPLIDNLRESSPGAKVIIMLRDPVRRAYSHYKWDLFLSGENGLRSGRYGENFGEYVSLALGAFPGPPPPTMLPTMPMLAAGIYVNSVRRWLDTYGRENVHLVAAEDFFADVSRTVCGIHEFLGLPAVEPELHAEVVNRNPLEYPPAEAESLGRLREFYRPYNEELFELLGRDLGWNHPA